MFKKVMKCDFSSENLFSNRDEDGFIVLDDKISDFISESREKVGNDDRIKNWIETNDGKQFLIKTNAMLDGEKNYTNYAELICMKLAEKMGIEYAHYDIIKINGIEGVISENILKKDEYLITLEDFIDSSMEHPDNPDIIDYPDVMRQLTLKLKEYGYNKSDSKKMLDEFNKRFILDSIVGATDRHAENISFIGNLKDNTRIKLSPIYDTENSLLLENNTKLVKEMALDKNYCSQVAMSVVPKIALVPNKEAQAEEIARATFELAISPKNDEDYVLEDYAAEILETINSNEIIAEVEEQINAPLPFEVKSVAINCMNKRMNELSKVLDGSVLVNYDSEYINKIKNIIKNQRKEINYKEDIT